jgi:arylsulfatase A-like enzyme
VRLPSLRSAVVALAAGAAVAAVLQAPSPGRGRAPRAPNVLLVSIDTLRADHLGAWGYARDTSPRLDAFAKDALRYARVLAPAPWTLPSHAAMLTGRHPYELGILDSEGVVPLGAVTLAERLHEQGYATAAFVDSDESGFLGALRGFARGFDSFSHAPFKTRRTHEYDMKATAAAALDWLGRRDPQRPFFLFVHTKSVHATSTQSAESDAPYDKPAPYRLRFVPGRTPHFAWRENQVFGTALLRQWNEQLATGEVDKQRFEADRLAELQAFYDGGIRYTDEHLGRLLDELRSRGLLDDTIVAITADHGEAFLEHDFFLHQEVRRELLEVPLLLRVPQGPRGRVVPQTVHLEDVMPTLLTLAGLEPPPGVTGVLLPPFGPAAPRPRLSFFRIGGRNLFEAYAVEDGPWKLVYQRRARDAGFEARLYDRRQDPGETRAVDDAARATALQAALVGYFQPGAERPKGALEMTPEALENLRALGYVR